MNSFKNFNIINHKQHIGLWLVLLIYAAVWAALQRFFSVLVSLGDYGLSIWNVSGRLAMGKH